MLLIGVFGALLRPAAAAGRLRARPSVAARRDPAAVPRALPAGRRALRHRPLDPGRDRRDRDQPRPLDRARRPLRRQHLRLLRRPDAVLDRRLAAAPGTATASTATATAASSPYDPEDAIPAAARYLRASGAPADYRRAIFAYNHADWYVADVLAQAELYRGAATGTAGSPGETASIRELLANPRIILTPGQRADLRAGGIDPRLLATLAWIGRRHTIVITALRADHYPGTNHEAGRAMDIGAVDGEICRGARFGACADLVRELAAVTGPTRSTELIYCWDPDGPPTRAASPAPTTATTSTGAWTHDGGYAATLT